MKKQAKKLSLFLFSGILAFSVSCNGNIQKNDLTNISALLKKQEPVAPKPKVIEIPSPNQNPRPEGAKISAIILHHTAGSGTAEQVGRFFANPNAKVSSHYTVDRTGYVVQSVPDSERSWHAGRSEFNGVGNVNDFSIGIEICNIGDSLEPYPETQYDGIIKLVAFLVKAYDVPLESITRHRDITLPAGRKIDTSNNFSVEKVLIGVKQILEGTYNPPQTQPPQPIDYPAFKEIQTKKGEVSLSILAEKYLDNEHRSEELKIANPQLKNPDKISEGTKIKIPTGYEFFYQLYPRK